MFSTCFWPLLLKWKQNTHTHNHTYAITCMHIHIYMHTDKYAYAHKTWKTQAYTNMPTCTHIHVYVHACMHTQTWHTQKHTQIYTHTYIYTYVYTWITYFNIHRCAISLDSFSIICECLLFRYPILGLNTPSLASVLRIPHILLLSRCFWKDDLGKLFYLMQGLVCFLKNTLKLDHVSHKRWLQHIPQYSIDIIKRLLFFLVWICTKCKWPIKSSFLSFFSPWLFYGLHWEQRTYFSVKCCHLFHLRTSKSFSSSLCLFLPLKHALSIMFRC